jgi:galactarate dehydratase
MNDLSPQRLPAVEVPRLIRMHENDNVAIVANDFGLPAATQINGLRLREHVPQGHKVAFAKRSGPRREAQ